jgi:hypothetical protein
MSISNATSTSDRSSHHHPRKQRLHTTAVAQEKANSGDSSIQNPPSARPAFT